MHRNGKPIRNLMHIDDTDSDSEDSDDDEPEESRPPIMKRTKRRASICAEKMCPIKIDSEQIKKIPKSKEQADRIMEILKNHVLFEHLDELEANSVQDAMFLVEYNRGDEIIKQGDDGDNFYIVESGVVEIFIASEKADCPELVATCSEGDAFGELAIMYNEPRKATCVASGDVKLWALDRVSYKVILMQTAMTKRNQYKSFLQNVPILSQLTEYEVLTIVDALREESFVDGAFICNEGEEGDQFYIIKDGTAICSKASHDGVSKQVASLVTGSYFGEVSSHML
jgi:cAMP-dependent protein kinase regulator